MTRLACQYAIVRFLPYAETGEFANVGVILVCPEKGYLHTRLMPLTRTKRITDFFDALDAKIYRDAMRFFRDETEANEDWIELSKEGNLLEVFQEVIRPREALLRFSSPRAILVEDPQLALNALFNRYVERDFATKEYHEEMLNKGVAQLLKNASLKSLFEGAKIGDDTISVKFPFVHKDVIGKTLAIKPLHLDKDEPSKIIEHGGPWVDRVNRLRRHALLPKGTLFAVQIPLVAGKQFDAASEIVQDLVALGVEVADIKDEQRILNFAKQARPN
jgi:hypothetical protein